MQKGLKEELTKEDYTNLVNKIKQLNNQGFSRKRIAKELNISIDRLRTLYKNENIIIQNSSLEERTKQFAEALHKKDNTKIYYSGFKNIDDKVYIKCLKCNSIYLINAQAIRGRHKKIQCKVCDEVELNKRKEKRNHKKIYKQTKLYLIRNANNLYSDKQLVFNVCEYCGSLFVGNTKYCGSKCYNKKRYFKANRIRLARAKANGKVDYTITLTKLIKRDNNKCYICGGECNLNDYTYQGNQFIAGNYYPSIDHVIPLAKGGTHQWNNVRLAHRICNSKKQDKLLQY